MLAKIADQYRVGEHVDIFSYANMLVATTNRDNISGNKCWWAILAEMLAWFAPAFMKDDQHEANEWTLGKIDTTSQTPC